MTNSRAREGNRQGSQAERIKRKRKFKKEQEKKEEDAKDQSPSYTVSQRVRSKERYVE